MQELILGKLKTNIFYMYSIDELPTGCNRLQKLKYLVIMIGYNLQNSIIYFITVLETRYKP